MLIMAGEGNEIADRKLEQIGKEMRKLKENSKELNLQKKGETLPKKSTGRFGNCSPQKI